jgi:hypothetical protein
MLVMETTEWTIEVSNRVRKQREKLPVKIFLAAKLLLEELEKYGPEANSWPNFGPIHGKAGYFHCHLNKGRPRYVAVWRVRNNEIHVIEVRYVGTHEGVNYNRID